jgi:hypothetical protein
VIPFNAADGESLRTLQSFDSPEARGQRDGSWLILRELTKRKKRGHEPAVIVSSANLAFATAAGVNGSFHFRFATHFDPQDGHA